MRFEFKPSFDRSVKSLSPSVKKENEPFHQEIMRNHILLTGSKLLQI